MSDEKPKTKNQIVLGKVDFIKSRGWNQFREGNSSKGLVWKDPKSGSIFNLETAYATEKIRDKQTKAGKTGGGSQGVVTSEPLTSDQKKELAEKDKSEKTKSKK